MSTDALVAAFPCALTSGSRRETPDRRRADSGARRRGPPHRSPSGWLQLGLVDRPCNARRIVTGLGRRERHSVRVARDKHDAHRPERAVRSDLERVRSPAADAESD
ncbi:MAG: hypothetical protein IPL45_02305 [Actinomycetales bacterium]|nr:hypothetical protein [Actinomycetales bacterium]